MKWTDLVDRFKRASGLTDRQVEALAAAEKRRATRVRRQVALLGFRESGEKLSLLAIEFGASGLRVECAARLQKGEVLKLALEHGKKHVSDIDTDDDAPSVRVVWVRRPGDLPNHQVGLAFVVDTPEQRRAAAHFVLDDCRVGIRDPRESRKLPRVRAEMEALVQTADGATIAAKARDIALGGVLLDVPRSMERGTSFDLKVFLPDAEQALVCRAEVVRCARVGTKTHEVGAAFTSVAENHRERLVACLSEMLRRKA
ncbi:MAG: PilZ domain-containing protein [Armatimonadetes bacterium]|nr:PilZ domain-containing protein [Armatimonadota bacterium]